MMNGMFGTEVCRPYGTEWILYTSDPGNKLPGYSLKCPPGTEKGFRRSLLKRSPPVSLRLFVDYLFFCGKIISFLNNPVPLLWVLTEASSFSAICTILRS